MIDSIGTSGGVIKEFESFTICVFDKGEFKVLSELETFGILTWGLDLEIWHGQSILR